MDGGNGRSRFALGWIVALASTCTFACFDFRDAVDRCVESGRCAQTTPDGGGAADADAGADGGWTAPRVEAGLLVLYRFEEGTGESVADVSGVGDPLDLFFRGDAAAATWIDGGSGVRFEGDGGVLSTAGPASKITSALLASSQITLEFWGKPALTSQTGPARLVSISNGVEVFHRVATLSQDRTAANFRLHAGPYTDLVSVDGVFEAGRLIHLVATYDGTGIRIYSDGAPVALVGATGGIKIPADDKPLLVGNEATLDRTWFGEVYLVAVYDRALTPEQVQQNFAAGPRR